MNILRRLLTRHDPAVLIDKELRFHVEELADHHEAAGLPRHEAVRRAQVELGGIPQISENVREVWAWRWLDEGLRDLQFAWRTCRRSPMRTLTAVLTLALGLGVNIALFGVVRQVLLRALPVANPHELVEIDCQSGPGTTGGGRACMHSYPAFRLLTARPEGLTGIVAFAPVPNGVVASFEGRREVIAGQLASANTFELLGVHPTAGRLLQPADDRPGAEMVVVLSYGYWLRAFGGRGDVIGRALTLNDRAVTIAGVLPRAFHGVTFGASYDVMLPLGAADAFRRGPSGSILETTNMGWLTFMGRRLPTLSLDDVARRLEPVFKQSAEDMLAAVPLDAQKRLNLSADGIHVQVRPAALGAQSNVRETLAPTLRVIVVVAVLILLITCANLAGLFLAHATNRQREFGLRLALGAGRSRLLRQVFTESALIAALGGGLGLLLAQSIGPAGFTLATDETGLRAVDLAPDRWMLAATAALSLLAGLMIGAGTVWRASSANPQEALRYRHGDGSTWLTKALVTAQIALTLALVGSAGLLLQTLTNFRQIDSGFAPETLLTVTMDAGLGSLGNGRATEYVRHAADVLAALPGVASVTYSNKPIGAGIPINLLVTPTATATEGGASGVLSVGPHFVGTVGLHLLGGRDLDLTDRENSSPVAIVNESFATRFFGTRYVVGRTFSFTGPGNPAIVISGVVKDARDRGVKRPAEPVAYLPYGQREVNTVAFTIRASNSIRSISDVVRRTLERIDPRVGIAQVRTMQDQFDDVLRRERLLAALATVFGGLGLLLLGVGCYGMLHGMVVRRTTEIGVRIALGASRARIVRMLAAETMTILGTGLALGLAGYLAAGRAIRSELFGITAFNATTTSAAIALLVGIAALAVGLPAYRATLIEPSEALRYDQS